VIARLHHAEHGSAGAPVLVLGTSLGTTVTMWDPQVPHLADEHHVVVLDHRGHGGSEVVAGPATIDDLGADVLAKLDLLGVDRFAWVGLSLGGMVGMWLASNVPDRVERLALLCTAAHLPPASAWHDRAATVRANGTAAVAEAVVARWFTPGFVERRRAVVDAHRAMLLATPDEGYAACCEVIAAMDLRAALAAVVAPTMVIAGADDPATPPSFATEIARTVPGARLEIVDEAAHLANVEQPALVTRLLLDHLAG
jgi:3-oxoadipate enol-lactonase